MRRVSTGKNPGENRRRSRLALAILAVLGLAFVVLLLVNVQRNAIEAERNAARAETGRAG